MPTNDLTLNTQVSVPTPEQVAYHYQKLVGDNPSIVSMTGGPGFLYVISNGKLTYKTYNPIEAAVLQSTLDPDNDAIPIDAGVVPGVTSILQTAPAEDHSILEAVAPYVQPVADAVSALAEANPMTSSQRVLLFSLPIGYDSNGNPLYYTDTDTYHNFLDANNAVARTVADVFLLGGSGVGDLAYDGANWIGRQLFTLGGKETLKALPKMVSRGITQVGRRPGYYFSKLMNSPITTDLIDGITLSALGSYGVDLLSEATTGRTWAENFEQMSGYPKIVSEMSNPGGWVGVPGVVSAVSEASNQVAKSTAYMKDLLLRFDNLLEFKASKATVIEELKKIYPGLRNTECEKMFENFIYGYQQLKALEALGISPTNFDYDASSNVLRNLTITRDGKAEKLGKINETDYGIDWSIPKTSYSANLSKSGNLHVDLFGDKNNVVDLRTKAAMSPIVRGNNMSGAVLSSVMLPDFSEIISIPSTKHGYPNFSLIKPEDAGKMVWDYNGATPHFGGYSPMSFEQIVKLGKQKNGALFYPYPELNVYFNSLYTESIRKDIARVEEAFLNAAKDGKADAILKSTDDLLPYIQAADPHKAKMIQEKIANYKKGTVEADKLMLIKDIKNEVRDALMYSGIEAYNLDILNMPQYRYLKLSLDIQNELLDPTLRQMALREFNNYFKSVPGYRPLRIDPTTLHLMGHFPTFMFRKHGGKLLPKNKK